MEKKFLKASLAIWFVIAVLFVSVLIYGIINHGSLMNGNWGFSVLNVQKEQNVDIDGANNINLDFSSANINITTTDESQIKIVQKASGKLKEDEKFIVSRDGDTINISKNKSVFGLNIFFLNFSEQEIDIYLPKSYAQNLDVKLSSGNIAVNSDITLKTLKCAQSSGNFNCNYNINADQINLRATSGNIKANELTDNSYIISTTSGNVEISSLSGSGQVSSTSGNIRISYKDILENSDVRVTSGNIRLEVPKDLSFDFEGNCTSGDINSNFDLNYKSKRGNSATARVGSGPYKKITAKTTSGNINITN